MSAFERSVTDTTEYSECPRSLKDSRERGEQRACPSLRYRQKKLASEIGAYVALFKFEQV
jgi:hypothetical protein